MKYIIDNDLHIHSYLSKCSNDPEQTTERLLQYALDNNLKQSALLTIIGTEKFPVLTIGTENRILTIYVSPNRFRKQTE